MNRLLAVVACLSGASLHAGLDEFKNSTRERGAIYLEDMGLAPIRMRLERQVPVYYQADVRRFLGTMSAPADIQLEGLSGGAYYIRGRAEHGQDVTGWVKKADMPLDEKLLDYLRKVFDRQMEVNKLIAKNEVAMGMTGREVRASLGEPTRMSNHVDAQGKTEALEYAVFERVPQTQTVTDVYGRLYQQTVYVKVETGTLAVTLKNDTVVSVSEAKGNPLAGEAVGIVPPPIVLNGL